MFFLKLSRNSSRSWDWLGGGNRLFWSLEDRSLSDQEEHRVPFVSGGQAIRVSPTLFSENRASIRLRSRSINDVVDRGRPPELFSSGSPEPANMLHCVETQLCRCDPVKDFRIGDYPGLLGGPNVIKGSL